MSVERVTKKDADGHYYMSGDGIFSDWGVPEKFKGEDVDAVGTIEDILGDTYNLDRLRELVEADKNGRFGGAAVAGHTRYKSQPLEVAELKQ